MDKSTELLDHCEEQTTIHCGSCKYKDITNAGAEESVDLLSEAGWTLIKGKCLCPKCAKKAKK